MARFSLHAVGEDRPGIVASVTEALADIGCNLEDSRMTLLHGQFAIVLVLEAPGVSNGVAIEEALTPAIEELGIALLVHPIRGGEGDDAPHHLVGVSVRGADHPGLVARVARIVQGLGGNIVDLVGHVAPGGLADASSLELLVAIDEEALPTLRDRLGRLAIELQLRCDITEGVTRAP
jgi:glycine cleavage system transcriptional repressor